jgi:DNA-binding transcriptional ArsR family regulator
LDKLVSHHLRQPRSAGLARSREDGRMVLCSLSDRGRALLTTVATDVPQVAP